MLPAGELGLPSFYLYSEEDNQALIVYFQWEKVSDIRFPFNSAQIYDG